MRAGWSGLKRVAGVALALALLLTLAVVPAFAQSEDEIRAQVVAVLAASDTFSDWLVNYPDFFAEVYPIDADQWQADFYDNDQYNEWLGYGQVNISTWEITNAMAPKPLPPDVYQEQLELVETYVLNDPEVIAHMGEIRIWDHWTDFNRWEQRWDVYFSRGVESWVVQTYLDPESNYFSITDIVDPNELSAEEAWDADRNEAISLAYGGEGIDQALDGFDNWTTYSEQLDGPRWTVAFTSGDQQLFFALVDIEQDAVLQTVVGG